MLVQEWEDGRPADIKHTFPQRHKWKFLFICLWESCAGERLREERTDKRELKKVEGRERESS